MFVIVCDASQFGLQVFPGLAILLKLGKEQGLRSKVVHKFAYMPHVEQNIETGDKNILSNTVIRFKKLQSPKYSSSPPPSPSRSNSTKLSLDS